MDACSDNGTHAAINTGSFLTAALAWGHSVTNASVYNIEGYTTSSTGVEACRINCTHYNRDRIIPNCSTGLNACSNNATVEIDTGMSHFHIHSGLCNFMYKLVQYNMDVGNMVKRSN